MKNSKSWAGAAAPASAYARPIAGLDGTGRVIATVRKNGLQEIRVTLLQRGGCDLVDLRIFEATRGSQGEPRPSRAGICIVRAKLSELIQALQTAEEAA